MLPLRSWAVLVAPLGLLWHEFAGHALIGWLCGGRVARVHGFFAVDVVDVPTRHGESLTRLAGSVSTLLAAAAALWLLRRTRVDGARRAALAWVGTWSLDIVVSTLPSLSSARLSEPYEAAVALGIPGPLFQVLAIGGGLAVFVGVALAARAVPARARRSAWFFRVAFAIALLAAAASLAWYARWIPSEPRPSDLRTNWALEPATREQRWQEDVGYLASELAVRHRNAFFHCPREEFERAAAELRAGIARKSDEEVVVGLMRLVARIGDAHTAIDAEGLRPPFHRFAFSVYLFADGPVIFSAREAQKELIGCRLVEFGGVPAEEALRRVSTAMAYENESAFLRASPQLLCVPEIAHDAGLVPTAAEVEIVARDASGAEHRVRLTPVEAGEKLASAPMDPAQLPLSRQKRAHANWFELLDASKTLYLRYNACQDEPDQTVAALGDQMLEAIDAHGVDHVIVDLRANGGGNSGLLEPFLRGLKRRKAIAHPGGIVGIIGRGTFSSAHMHAVYLKEELGATLVGEPTGQKPNAYGEVRWFVLPNSRIAVRYSTKYWRLAEGDPPSLDPDVLVRATSSDYFSMRDPVLETALSTH